MIALLLTICAVSFSSAQEEPAELLRLLAATQKQTASTYDKLSFDASVLTTNYIEKLGKPLTVKSHYTVVKRSDTTLITRELHTSILVDEEPAGGGEATYEISNEPSVKRVLKTPEYIVIWGEIGFRTVLIYYAEDWQDALPNYEVNFEFDYRPVSIMKRCFGLHTPFYSLYEKEGSVAKWYVREFDPDGQMKVERALPDRDSNYVVDLRLSLDAESGLVRNVRYQVPHSASVGTSTVEYTTLALENQELRVPSRYRYRLTDDTPETEKAIDIDYSNIRDESAGPPQTLVDLGIPRGTKLSRVFRDDHIESSYWDGAKRSKLTGDTKR